MKKYQIEVGRLNFEGKISTGGNEHFVMLNVFPFVKEGSKTVRISSFRINYKKEKPTFNHVAKDFVNSSVLQPGSGSWYKVSVNRDGIFKIDKAFLESMGVDTDNLNPQHINIFGNGDGLFINTAGGAFYCRKLRGDS